MSLRAKILCGYAAILCLLGVMSVWAVTDLLALGRASAAILSENYRSILAAENMIDHLERQDSASLLALLGQVETGRSQFAQHQGEFQRWLARAEDNVTIDGEAEILRSIVLAYRDYVGAFGSLPVGPTPRDVAAAAYASEMLPPFSRVHDACVDLRELNQQTMVGASEQAQATSRRAVVTISAAGVSTALVGLVLSALLATVLTRPLRMMEGAAERLGSGDYDVELEVSSSDELGKLARQFTLMAGRLKGYHQLNVGQLLTEKRRVDAILRSIPDGIVVVDEALFVTAINPAAAEVFAVEPDSARGGHVAHLIRDDDVLRQMQAAGEDVVSEPDRDLVLQISRSGRERHYRCVVTPVRLESGPTQGAVLVLQDVTRLLAIDRLKDEFVMAASHELRTPLTGMAMSLGVLAERLRPKVDDDEQELLQAALHETGRLRALVEELLDLSRIETGRLEMEREQVTVDLMVESALVSLRPQIAERGIALAVELEPDLPPVETDPHKVVWVLTNLLSNAMRYTPPAGEIRVAASRIGGEVHVAVRDTGRGIPLEQQSRVFEKFVRLDDGTRPSGLGLGLALSRAIVKAQGGTIWVESAPGIGSTFTFTMPTAARAAAPEGGDHGRA